MRKQPKIEIYFDGGLQWCWRLKSNGNVMASARGYNTQQGARRACKRAAQLIPLAKIVVLP